MRKIAFIWFGLLLVVAGCTDSEVQQNEEQQSEALEEIEALKKNISELENQISIVGNQFSEVQEEQKVLEQMIMSHDGLGYGRLRSSQRMLEDLMSHLPGIDVRTGFITVMEKDSIKIDFAELVISAEAPNGFEIVNDSEVSEVLPLIEELTVFVVNGPDWEARTKDEFFPSNHFFFEFYIAGGKVIQMREVYLP